MKIAIFDNDIEAETWEQFDRNVTIKLNEDGSRYFETQANGCTYGQYYAADVSFADAQRRFVEFYFPLAVKDAKEASND